MDTSFLSARDGFGFPMLRLRRAASPETFVRGRINMKKLRADSPVFTVEKRAGSGLGEGTAQLTRNSLFSVL